MRFDLFQVTLAIVAVTTTACTDPNVVAPKSDGVQTGLTAEIETSLAELAGQINNTTDPAGVLVKAYERLENYTDGPPPRTNMIVVSLLEMEPNLPEIRLKKRTDVRLVSEGYLSKEELSVLSEIGLDDFVILTVEEGSTVWCVSTRAKRKCYEYP